MHGNITRKFPEQLPLSQTSKNVMFFFLSLSFFFYKVGEQEDRTDPAVGGGGAGKGGKRVDMVQKMCTLVCKCKNDTC
jgi:hypothetical protein